MRSVYVFVINRVYCHIHFLVKLKYVRASASVDVKFLYILPKKHIFFHFIHLLLQSTYINLSILHTLLFK